MHTSAPEDDAVHVDLAAKALRVSRRTVERMVDRGELERDRTAQGRVAAVTKRSLTAALESHRDDIPTRQPGQLTQALAAIEQLTFTLNAERLQLQAAAEDRRTAEREREDARVQAARLETERNALRAQLEAIATAGPIRALRLRRAFATSRRSDAS